MSNVHTADFPTIVVKFATGKGHAAAMAVVCQTLLAGVMTGLLDHHATRACLVGSEACATFSAWMHIAADMGAVYQRVHVLAIPDTLVLLARHVQQDSKNIWVPASRVALPRIVAKDLAAAEEMGPANVSPVLIVAS